MARMIHATMKLPGSDTRGNAAGRVRDGLVAVLKSFGAVPLYNEPMTIGRETIERTVLEWNNADAPTGSALLKIAWPCLPSGSMDLRVWVDLLGHGKIWEAGSIIALGIKGCLSNAGMKIETDYLKTAAGKVPVDDRPPVR